MIVTRSIENRGTLLKLSTENIIRRITQFSWCINESWFIINKKCTKNVLLPLGITAAASVVDTGIHE